MRAIYVCTNLRKVGGEASCAGRGSLDLIDLLQERLAARQLSYEVKPSVCFGHCEKGPNLKPAGRPFWHGASSENLEEFLDTLE